MQKAKTPQVCATSCKQVMTDAKPAAGGLIRAGFTRTVVRDIHALNVAGLAAPKRPDLSGMPFVDPLAFLSQNRSSSRSR